MNVYTISLRAPGFRQRSGDRFGWKVTFSVTILGTGICALMLLSWQSFLPGLLFYGGVDRLKTLFVLHAF